MPIIDKKGWEHQVKINDDPYSGAVIKAAKRAMEILDEEPGEFDCHTLICRADRESNAGGITGFMAGAAASKISKYHSRGKEFRKKWNIDQQIGAEGEKANKKSTVLDPALLTITEKT